MLDPVVAESEDDDGCIPLLELGSIPPLIINPARASAPTIPAAV
jgi:hypothetical protein